MRTACRAESAKSAGSRHGGVQGGLDGGGRGCSAGNGSAALRASGCPNPRPEVQAGALKKTSNDLDLDA
jgi:hypothetical protein